MNRAKIRLRSVLACAVLTATCSASLQAAESASCETVRFGTLSWTDLIATTAVASDVLERLGYQTKQSVAAQQIIMGALSRKNLDAFIGYWSPSSDSIVMPYVERGEAQLADAPNLADAQMALAVPSYVAEQGLRTYADLAKFKDKLRGRIYGIDPGTSVNGRVRALIDDNRFGLEDFDLIESSEAGMLAAVNRAVSRKEWVVFIAWKPHPMNLNMDLTYLTGSEDALGPDEGKATVWSVTRNEYAEECPNASRLLSQIQFTAEQESQMMVRLLDREDPKDVAKAFVDEHPQVIDRWLEGVTRFDGSPVGNLLSSNQP